MQVKLGHLPGTPMPANRDMGPGRGRKRGRETNAAQRLLARADWFNGEGYSWSDQAGLDQNSDEQQAAHIQEQGFGEITLPEPIAGTFDLTGPPRMCAAIRRRRAAGATWDDITDALGLAETLFRAYGLETESIPAVWAIRTVWLEENDPAYPPRRRRTRKQQREARQAERERAREESAARLAESRRQYQEAHAAVGRVMLDDLDDALQREPTSDDAVTVVSVGMPGSRIGWDHMATYRRAARRALAFLHLEDAVHRHKPGDDGDWRTLGYRVRPRDRAAAMRNEEVAVLREMHLEVAGAHGGLASAISTTLLAARTRPVRQCSACRRWFVHRDTTVAALCRHCAADPALSVKHAERERAQDAAWVAAYRARVAADPARKAAADDKRARDVWERRHPGQVYPGRLRARRASAAR